LVTITLISIASEYFNNAPAIEIPGFTHPVTDYYLEDILENTGHRSSLKTPKKKSGDSDLATWQRQYQQSGYSEATVKALEPYRNQESIDYELIVNTVRYITENDEKIDGGMGAILIFLPGNERAGVLRGIESLNRIAY
jgi:ATP-dependent RNA helicase DHX57